MFDLEMLEATGSCQGIENYSRYLTGRKPGEPPPTLFEYLPRQHASSSPTKATSPFRRSAPCTGATSAARRRWPNTASACPPAWTTGPLRFEEWNAMRPQSIAVSATPGSWEMDQSGGVFAEQVIRPTGLVDPPIDIRPASSQVDDLLGEVREVAAKGYRTLVTTLTKRMAEDLTEYLHENGVRVRYMHSDIDTLERIEIIRDLRLGAFDVLVGINLLREGLDIPECALVAILDADKEGFLRSETSLIQTIGRAARNVDGKVILYADNMTGSMERAIAETNRRREKQLAYNEEHGITPESVKRNIADILDSVYEQDHVTVDAGFRRAGLAGRPQPEAAHIERSGKADARRRRRSRLRDLPRACATRSSACRKPNWRSPTTPWPASPTSTARSGGYQRRPQIRRRRHQGRRKRQEARNGEGPGGKSAGGSAYAGTYRTETPCEQFRSCNPAQRQGAQEYFGRDDCWPHGSTDDNGTVAGKTGANCPGRRCPAPHPARQNRRRVV